MKKKVNNINKLLNVNLRKNLIDDMLFFENK